MSNQQTDQKDQPSPFSPRISPQAAPQTGPQAGPQTAPQLPLPAIPHLPNLGDGGPNGPNTMDKLFGHFADGLTAGGKFYPFQNDGPKPQVGPTVEAAATGHLAGAPAPTTSGAAATGAANAPVHHTRADYQTKLDAQLDAEIKGNRKTRTDLDKAKTDHLPTVAATQEKLDGDREHLLGELKERSGVYDESIHGINAKLGDKLPKNLTPEQKALVAQRTELEKEKGKFADQQTALQRWHDRREINSINEKLKDPKLAPQEKTKLLADKKKLATGLLSTTKHYEQFDDRWGSTVYGKDRSYTNMTEAGCGPTGLADLLDFADQEDPEGKHSQGIQDPYTPRTVANYATNHGRVKGSGTAGETMMGDLGQGFPGFTGNTLDNRAAATESLENGIPVLFLGHDMHGTRADGKDTKYGGHYMVLSGVSDDHKQFQVQDGGRNSERNIRTVTDKQLGAGAAGYWNVSHPQ